MTPLLQTGFAAFMLALSYAVTVLATTLALILIDRRYELFNRSEDLDD